jgi:hypothetical protein
MRAYPDDAFIVRLTFKYLETLELGRWFRCDTGPPFLVIAALPRHPRRARRFDSRENRYAVFNHSNYAVARRP